MGKMFNPPPGWPAPPSGWRPPPGWGPDPAWGPPPPGWPLWVQANPHPFLHTLAVQSAMYPVLIAAVAILTGQTAAEEVGALVGSSIVSGALVLLGVGLIARRATRPWSWWTYLGAVVGGGIILNGLTNMLVSAGSAAGG